MADISKTSESKNPAKVPTDGSFHSGVWDYEAKRPVVDGKFEDPLTGELRDAKSEQYSGPPSVDIVIMNLYASEASGPDVYRSARPFPVERILHHAMTVVKEEGLEIHCLNASLYSVTLVLACEIEERKDGRSGFSYVADRISNGLWAEE
ncbi:uncharacterized protein LY89DRAFT_723718 [Mollisia scopiformis]|uniref:Uncharacterized protein n=1 Tax=Mollisia scopiformis TaxID=149040 RepID=A0A132BDP1_MOLSC|nr:uncharacterized protein LY89DRAFT_723718 [Mollisia scopiformis]KUJ10540.1 hypothetical protein LY89DRAFT_723718 [Mollisia scopiformis]